MHSVEHAEVSRGTSGGRWMTPCASPLRLPGSVAVGAEINIGERARIRLRCTPRWMRRGPASARAVLRARLGRSSVQMRVVAGRRYRARVWTSVRAPVTRVPKKISGGCRSHRRAPLKDSRTQGLKDSRDVPRGTSGAPASPRRRASCALRHLRQRAPAPQLALAPAVAPATPPNMSSLCARQHRSSLVHDESVRDHRQQPTLHRACRAPAPA